MKKLLVIGLLLAVCMLASPAVAVDVKDYGGLTLNSPWTTTHWDEVWDLTQGDLTLSYTIDMTGLHQPGTCNNYDGSTSYTEVGLRGEGAADFNPGPWNTYQGNCGGWMVSDDDTWNDGDGLTEYRCLPKDSTQDLDDKHGLQTSGGRGERDYDVLLSDPDTVISPPIGSWSNYGIWFDRDGVDPWQDDDPLTPPPGGSGVPWGAHNGQTYNTGGIYDIVITYHAIDANHNGEKTDDGLGVMFATVNSIPQGFYTTWHPGAPDYYPAGLSFKGDMEHMQVFAGLWAPDATYGPIVLSDIHVEGILGTSDPLVADFTYSPTTIFEGDNVQFTDTSHGGMPPYTYSWKFYDDSSTTTLQNPTHTFTTAGTYNVKLTVTPFRCVPRSITKQLTVYCPAWLNVIKFYDANANGLNDDEQLIEGWPINIGSELFSTPVEDLKLPPGTYTVSESPSGVWMSTTDESVEVELDCDDVETVEFGNLCLGAGYPNGGFTPGYWSNKNGEATMKDGGTLAPELALLSGLNLRNKDGSNFDPATYNQFKTWLLKAEATNMAYKLSSSLAAMVLNVEAGFVNPNALVYAPGVDAANDLGFISINDLMTAANTALGADGSTPAGDPNRAIQEAMYKALDNANNNYNFVQQEPCAFVGPD